jgi:hypothetical protein
MFERYTEKARRVIFFARFEASQYGSKQIESEHLLLGLLHENKDLRDWMPKASLETVRAWVDEKIPHRERISTSIDLPLSDSSRTILKAAADEADRMSHLHIGTEHLFLGLFAVKDSLATELLQRAGANPESVRARISKPSEDVVGLLQNEARFERPKRILDQSIEIHGMRRNVEYIRDVVSTVRSYNWHWHKKIWRPRDIVINRKSGRFSFEMTLAEDTDNFAVVPDGWRKDHCFVCRWELFESDDEHGIGYTNGRNWLCMECCERFIQKNFFSSSYPEIT